MPSPDATLLMVEADPHEDCKDESMTTTSSSVKPSSFRLPGYEILVGPFTHVAEERDRLAGLRWQAFEARQLGSTVGAELSGVDLTTDLPDEVIAEIRQALYDYKVIFFRDQPMNPQQHVAFARRFGELEIHPFLPSNTGEAELVRFEKTAEVSGYENSWHHDVTWRECPSMGAVLHALAVPDQGGDTLFSDMHAAYDALGRCDQAVTRRSLRHPRLHPDLRSRHVSGGAPSRPGEISDGAPSGCLHPPGYREAPPLCQSTIRQSH